MRNFIYALKKKLITKYKTLVNNLYNIAPLNFNSLDNVKKCN